MVSLQKLLVREKAGQESRGIYLISSNPADPEMFELKVHKPKDKQIWIQAIRYGFKSNVFFFILKLFMVGLLCKVARKKMKII